MCAHTFHFGFYICIIFAQIILHDNTIWPIISLWSLFHREDCVLWCHLHVVFRSRFQLFVSFKPRRLQNNSPRYQNDALIIDDSSFVGKLVHLKKKVAVHSRNLTLQWRFWLAQYSTTLSRANVNICPIPVYPLGWAVHAKWCNVQPQGHNKMGFPCVMCTGNGGVWECYTVSALISLHT